MEESHLIAVLHQRFAGVRTVFDGNLYVRTLELAFDKPLTRDEGRKVLVWFMQHTDWLLKSTFLTLPSCDLRAAHFIRPLDPEQQGV